MKTPSNYLARWSATALLLISTRRDRLARERVALLDEYFKESAESQAQDDFH